MAEKNAIQKIKYYKKINFSHKMSKYKNIVFKNFVN